jgi:hypothetical protein
MYLSSAENIANHLNNYYLLRVETDASRIGKRQNVLPILHCDLIRAGKNLIFKTLWKLIVDLRILEPFYSPPKAPGNDKISFIFPEYLKIQYQ